MALFAIGDLHLSGSSDKPMDVFGEHWVRHQDKIQQNWIDQVKETDTVLIPGDISWAMRLDEAMTDLEWIHHLPGNKLLLRGNHDYWWSSVTKLNNLFHNMQFIQNNFQPYQGYGICGTRGWLCPNESKFDGQDEKIYYRELQRLQLSIEEARKKGYQKIIVMTHYPPTNDRLEPSGFTEIYEAYGVEKVVYGHLHGKDSFGCGLKGNRNGVEYSLVSCDFLEFSPVKLLEV